jgi:hypothetical protein
MKTVMTEVFTFDELSETAKTKAIENYRNKDNGNEIYFDEIIESEKKVIDIFNLKTGREYSDIRTSHIDDTILELKGVRLFKYLINNYGNDLFTPKYIKCIDKEFRCKLFICEVKTGRDGKKYTLVYSKTKRDNSCTLTGTCYDEAILKPIYDFLKKPKENTTFEDLMNEIGEAISKTFSDTEEWINSDEFIAESLESNSYEFTEDGNIF